MDKFVFTLDTNDDWLSMHKVKWGLICGFLGEKDPDWESIPLTRNHTWIIAKSADTNHAGAVLIRCLERLSMNLGVWAGFFPQLSSKQQQELKGDQFTREATILLYDNFTKKVWSGSVYEAIEKKLEEL